MNGLRGVTLRQLRAFSLLAQHHSFTLAATELHLTPSAVSLQIKELEQSVGLPLFVRNGKAVSSLTQAGQLLLADVHRALHALQDADDTLGRLRARRNGTVSIGMISNSKYFLPRLLAGFREHHRDIELRVSLGNREQLLEQLRCGQVDIAVMGAPPSDLEACADPFGSQPLGIVAAPQHTLSRRQSVPVAALAEHEFIVRESGSGTRAAMERFFGEAHVEPRRIMEMPSNEAIKQAVIANMGLAFLSLHAVGLELQESLLVTINVVGLPLVRRWFVVHMASSTLSEECEVLRKFIVQFGERSITDQFGTLVEPAYASRLDLARCPER